MSHFMPTKKTALDLFKLICEIAENPFNVNNRENVHQLQSNLIKKIIFCEKQIQKLNLVSSEITDKFNKDLPTILNNYKYKRFFYKSISDALVFSLIDNHYDIKYYQDNTSSGFISGKEGFKQEVKLFELIFQLDKNLLPVLCDITNCLRYGDIAIFEKNSKVKLIEVKGKKFLNSRSVKQKLMADNIHGFLNNGHAEYLLHRTGNFLQSPQNIEAENHREQLNLLANRIYQAKQEKYVMDEVEEGVVYIAFKKENEKFALPILEGFKNEKWVGTQINPEKYFEKPYYYPITLSIKNPNALYDIFSYKLIILVFINIHVFVLNLTENKKILLDKPKNKDFMFTLKLDIKDSYEMSISVDHFTRCFYEFLNIKIFTKEMVNLLNFAQNGGLNNSLPTPDTNNNNGG